jgi:hypothetical protein
MYSAHVILTWLGSCPSYRSDSGLFHVYFFQLMGRYIVGKGWALLIVNYEHGRAKPIKYI